MDWVAVVTTMGTLLFAVAGAAFTIDRTINGKLQRIICVLDKLEKRLDDLEKDEQRHRQAGLAYALQMHHSLVTQDLSNIPDPRDYSGL